MWNGKKVGVWHLYLHSQSCNYQERKEQGHLSFTATSMLSINNDYYGDVGEVVAAVGLTPLLGWQLDTHDHPPDDRSREDHQLNQSKAHDILINTCSLSWRNPTQSDNDEIAVKLPTLSNLKTSLYWNCRSRLLIVLMSRAEVLWVVT